MVVNIMSEFKHFFKNIHSRYKNRLRLGLSGYSQLFFYAFLFCYPSYSYAGPNLSGVVGGDASAIVHTHGLTTEIHQNINSVAIDWNSFNVNSNEVVNFVQPGSSSIALNQILSTSASDIRGQINANGQIVLVNPNGIFFGETASVNVGGLIASGLNISTTDFLNGDYIFNEVVGTDGFVINRGLINASLGGLGGGNVALLGKQVTNEGVISAQLGSVNLAAGKAAVITFDQQGLVGVQVTKAILQDELGLDPAVLNSGEINAEGGRVLLTASVSQDVFSQAVNSGGMEQATSVVVNEDGSFTLGAGANVVNTGVIDVSSDDAAQAAGKVIILGENVTSSGTIKADSLLASAGEIELHSADTTLLTDNSLTSATAENSNTGGTIKILGKYVGLFDQSVINVSGENGGGRVFIGGDYQGKNNFLRNAQRTYVSEQSVIYADAVNSGKGGTVIIWADDVTRFFGSLYATGGRISGDGGFAEISGKQSLYFDGIANLSANVGAAGEILFDPTDIIVRDSGSDITGDVPFGASDGTQNITPQSIVDILNSGTGTTGTDVTLQANRDIIVTNSIGVTDTGVVTTTASLNLDAGDDIFVNASITLAGGSLNLEAGHAGGDVGDDTSTRNISIFNAITTNGGDVTLTTDDLVDIRAEINTTGTDATNGDFQSTSATFTGNNTSANIITAGSSASTITAGDVTINASGSVTLGAIDTLNDGTGDVAATTGDLSVTSTGGTISQDTSGNDTETQARLLKIGGATSFIASNGVTTPTLNNITIDIIDSNFGNTFVGDVSFTGNDVTLRTINSINLGLSTAGGFLNIRSNGATGNGNITQSGAVTVVGNATLRADNDTINLNNSANDFSTVIITNANNVTLQDTNAIALQTTNAILNDLTITAGGAITDSATISVTGDTTLTAGSTNNITFNNNDDFGGDVYIISGNDVTLTDTDSIALGSATGVSTISGFLTVNAVRNITDSGTLSVAGVSTFTSSSTSTNDSSQINLNNVNNNFQDRINLSTANYANGDITLTNSAETTTLGAVTAFGNLTVNAAQHLTIDGSVNVVNNRSGNNNSRRLGLNFGTGGSASTFLLDDLTTSGAGNTGNITTTVGSGDTVDITIDGDTNIDTFDLNNAISTNRGSVNLSGNNGNDIFNINTGIDINGTLAGNANNDTFNINTNSINATSSTTLNIEGNGGSNELIGFNDANTWTIDRVDGGTLNTRISFSTINNLTGNENTDDFSFTTNTASIDGLIDGGDVDGSSTVNDTLTFDTDTGAKVVVLTDAAVLGNANLEVRRIETITADVNNANELIRDVASNWFINGAGAGSVGTGLASHQATAVESVTIFSNFNTLTGSTAADNFAVTSAYSSNTPMTINGGTSATSTEYDTLDLSATSVDSDWTLSSAVNGTIVSGAAINLAFTDAENLIAGSGTADTLTADFGNDNTWTISNNGNIGEVGSGRLEDTSDIASGTFDTTTFKDFENITGGTAVDIFDIQSTANISGIMSGGADNDVFNIVNPASVGSLQGAGGDDTFNINAQDVAVAIDGGADTDTLIGSDFVNTWTIDGTNNQVAATGGGTVTFQAIENLTGGSVNDTFNFTLTGAAELVNGGGGTTNTITGKAAANAWVLSAANEGSVNVGGADYIRSFIGIQEIIGGSLATDTLTSFDNPSTWTLSDRSLGLSGSGTIASIIDFRGMETVIGGAGVDTFNIEDSVTIANINGAAGADIFSINGTNITIALTIDGGSAAAYGDSPTTFDTLIAPDIANPAPDLANPEGFATQWVIDATAPSNTLTSLNSSNALNVNFNNIENLTGGSGNDNFIFNSLVIGLVSGGGHFIDRANNIVGDQVNYSAVAVPVTLENVINLPDPVLATNPLTLYVNDIENIAGNGGTFIGANAYNVWVIDGANAGYVSSDGGERTYFTGYSSLLGNDGIDEFTINNDGGATTSGSLDGTLSGGGTNGDAVTDILTINYNSGVDTAWSISDVNQGSVDGINGGLADGFNGIESIVAGAQNDTFNFGVNGVFDGNINAGAGTDSINLSSLTDIVFDLASGFNGRLLFEEVVGNINTTSTIAGDDAGNLWIIDGENTGTIGSLRFTDFNNITGGTAADTFRFDPTGNITGLINGGSGTGNDIIQLGAGNTTGFDVQMVLSTLPIPVGDNNNSRLDIINVEQVDLSAASAPSTLYASNEATTWLLSASNTGFLSVSDSLNSVPPGNAEGITQFNNFSILNGGTAVDIFKVNGGTVTGSIIGGMGSDEIMVTASGNSWLLSSDNVGNLNASLAFSSIENLTGNNDTLTGPSATNTWTITEITAGNPIGDLNNNLDFTGMTTVTGGSFDDTFDLSSAVTAGTYNGGISGSDIVNQLDGSNVWLLSTDNSGTLNTSISFNDIDVINGNNDSLTGPSITSNTWTIIEAVAGNPTGDLNNNLDFTGISTVNGGSLDDTFDLASTVTAGTYNGGTAGNDIINRLTGANVWLLSTDNNGTLNTTISFNNIDVINGNNGSLTGPSVGNNTWTITEAVVANPIGDLNNNLDFTGISTVTGGSLDDTFDLASTVTAGTYNGGTAGNDIINRLSGANVWQLNTDNSGTLNTTISFSGIDEINGNNGSLTGPSVGNNTWTITEAVAGSPTGDLNNNIDFTGISSVTGGNLVDTFDLDSNVSTGTYNGGTGGRDIINRLTGTNSWQLTTNNNGTLNAVISFNDIDVINGNSGTLTGPSVSSNMWNITSDYAGNINSSMEFTSMTQMNGGTTADTFSLSRAVANGSFNGGATASDTIMLATEAGVTDADTNAWDVTGDGAGTIKGTTFTAMETLTGNDGIDNFTLSTNLFSGTINGGANIDSLSAFNDSNTWVINDVDGGTYRSDVSMDTLTFATIENLIGNVNTDSFSVTDAGSLSGTLDGGTGIDDSINLAAKSTGISVTLGSSLATIAADLTAVDMFNTNNIETITAPVPTAEGVVPVITNTIIGADVDQIFIIDGANSGAVGPVALVDTNTGLFPVGDTDGVTRFNNFDNIQGGIFADIFRIVDGGSFGSIDGGTHPDDLPGPPVQIDTIDLNSTGVIDLAVGDTSAFGSGVTNVEGINGNSTQSILRASDAGSVWTITGVNSGTVVSDGNTTNFTGFNILQGGAGVDEFNITSTGAIGNQSAVDTISRLSGGGGNDELNVDLSGGNAKINLFTADGLTTSDLNNNTIAFSTEANNPGNADRVNITGIAAGFDTATYSVDYTTGIVTHTYENTSTPATASIAYTGVTRATGPNPTVIVDSVQASNLIISGNNSTDTVTLIGNGTGAGNFDLSRASNPIDWADVDYSNKESLTVNNLGVGGTIIVMSNIDVDTTSGFIDFSAENINTGVRVLTGNELRLDSVINTTNGGAPVFTSVANLQVTDSTANINIQETDGVNLNQVDTTGTLNIVANGTITDGVQALSSTGNFNVTATGAGSDIVLDNTLNNLTGIIGLNTDNGGTVTLVNDGTSTRLGDSSVGLTGTLNITSNGGSITSDQTIISGNANLDSVADIVLSNAANDNDFNIVSIAGANSATIQDSNDLVLGDVRISGGSLQIDATSVNQVDGTSIIQTANQFGATTGNMVFNIGAGIIDLGNLTNDFVGDVVLNNSAANFVEIADANTIRFAASNIGSGTFTVNANGTVTQSGRISQEAPADINASMVSINAGDGSIDLTNINNNFTGTINLTNTNTDTVALTNANNIVLAGSDVRGDFNMIARNGSDISQNAMLSVVNDASFTVDAGRSIVLDEALNNLQGSVSFNSNNGLALLDVTIANNRALQLGDINVSNNLDVLANGIITNDGVLTVGQNAWFDATGNDITVANAANNFNNIVFENASTVSVSDTDGINFGSTDATRMDSNIAVDLSVITLVGNITDTSNSALAVTGTANLTAGTPANAGNITLDETANEFNRVNIINAQDVSLVDADTATNGFDIRSNLIAGNLAVTSAGNITNSNDALSGALTVNGTASFTAANAGSILLNNSANALTGALTFSATTPTAALADVAVVNTLATNINALNISNDLSITSGGAITQNAAFTVGNLTTLDAINTNTLVAQDIVLERPNNLNAIRILNANNVTISNGTNALSSDQLNVAGVLDIASGALTITDNDITASSVALNSGAGATTVESITTPGLLSITSEGLIVNGSISVSNYDINSGGAVAVFANDITATGALDNSIIAMGITLNGLLNTVSNTTLNATSSVANLNRDITLSNGDLLVNGAGINQLGNIAVQNDVTFASTLGIAMGGTASTTVTDGSIQYNANDTVNVGLLSALNGTAGVSTLTNISDANGSSVNFLALNMQTRTGAGMGTGDSNRIGTQVETMDVINSGSGALWIEQTGELEIVALQNDAVRTSATDPNGITNIRTDDNFLINPNSVIVDRDTGVLFMITTNGSYLGTGAFISGTNPETDPNGSLINPDFTANQATFFGVRGDFGSAFRPLVLNVPRTNNSITGEDSFIFIDTLRVSARYYPEEPVNLTTTGIDVSGLGVLSAIAGELLVEVESLGDIDPAIFTDLQNYSLQDVSIRMPRDQLFEDELEDDARLQ